MRTVPDTSLTGSSRKRQKLSLEAFLAVSFCLSLCLFLSHIVPHGKRTCVEAFFGELRGSIDSFVALGKNIMQINRVILLPSTTQGRLTNKR